MGTVVEKANPANFRQSANTSDFPKTFWLRNPPGFETLLGTVDPKYWKLNIRSDDIEEMTTAEKASLDSAETAKLVADTRFSLTSEVDGVFPRGVDIRSLIQLMNKRDNYLVARINELQSAFDAIKATTGGGDNIRSAIPFLWLPANPRSLPKAIQDYKDGINSGAAD